MLFLVYLIHSSLRWTEKASLEHVHVLLTTFVHGKSDDHEGMKLVSALQPLFIGLSYFLRSQY